MISAYQSLKIRVWDIEAGVLISSFDEKAWFNHEESRGWHAIDEIERNKWGQQRLINLKNNISSLEFLKISVDQIRKIEFG